MENRIDKIFAKNVFSLQVMKKKLPDEIYRSIKSTILNNTPLDPNIVPTVANALKNWAIEKGASHYTHWFHPMTGNTAQKLDSFLSKSNNKVILELSGKDLLRGEPDASSFPSGGLRATFEARGYTAWDVSSYAFVRNDGNSKTLYIPTAFYSYTMESLDEKIPLLKSMELLNNSCINVLNLFEDNNTKIKRVKINLGVEQEYFLLDKDYLAKRTDVLLTGRTLFGALPPKGQELDDHYFSALKDRVAVFMSELDRELWKIGVMAKTKHNEVAPTQCEIVPYYESANIACDHNYIIMDTLKRLAGKHNFYCLLHEKPYKGINGSGKHNNWSLETNTGENLLDPGKTPHKNLRFLLILSAIIKGIDEYPELLRASTANPGNDLRLGENEAPPAIISISIGGKLLSILEGIENNDFKTPKELENFTLGVNSIIELPKDDTDRNRTSPFAFSGNKFEFRAVPSSGSIAFPTVILNTIVANSLNIFYDKLKDSKNLKYDVLKIVKDTMKKHKKIIFNGDGYSKEWFKEANKRNLPNIKNTYEAAKHIASEKTIKLLSKHSVLNQNELKSRQKIMYESYSKQINVELKTMISMVQREIMPAILNYSKKIANSINCIKEASSYADLDVPRKLLDEISSKLSLLYKELVHLKRKGDDIEYQNSFEEKAKLFSEKILPIMELLREAVDDLELLISKKDWPYPIYEDLFFRF